MERKIEELREFLLENGHSKRQTFNTRNSVGDYMETIYSKNGILVDICKYWDYLEIFGLTQEEYEGLADILDVE